MPFKVTLKLNSDKQRPPSEDPQSVSAASGQEAGMARSSTRASSSAAHHQAAATTTGYDGSSTSFTNSGRPSRAAAKADVTYNEEELFDKGRYTARSAPLPANLLQQGRYSVDTGSLNGVPQSGNVHTYPHQQQAQMQFAAVADRPRRSGSASYSARQSNPAYNSSGAYGVPSPYFQQPGTFQNVAASGSGYIAPQQLNGNGQFAAFGAGNGSDYADQDEYDEAEGSPESNYEDGDDDEYGGKAHRSQSAKGGKGKGKATHARQGSKGKGRVSNGSAKPTAPRRQTKHDSASDDDYHARTDPDSVEVSANGSADLFPPAGMRSSRQAKANPVYTNNHFEHSEADDADGETGFLEVPPARDHAGPSSDVASAGELGGALFGPAATVTSHAAPLARNQRTVLSEDDEAGVQQNLVPVYAHQNGQKAARKSAFVAAPPVQQEVVTTAHGRIVKRLIVQEASGSEEDDEMRLKSRRANKGSAAYQVDGDDDGSFKGDDNDASGDDLDNRRRPSRGTAVSRRALRKKADSGEDDYMEPEPSRRKKRTHSSDGSSDTSGPELDDDDSGEDELKREAKWAKRQNRKHSNLVVEGGRKRVEVDYNVVNLADKAFSGEGVRKVKSTPKKKRYGYGAPQRLPFNMSGKQLGALFGDKPPDSDSDDDDAGITPRRPGLLGSGGVGAIGYGADYALPAGTPSNLGKTSGATNLADIDPLLPSSKLSFDQIGGLQSHIQQLKEMVALPLLYPQIFQRFGITPPRGVLFHGPPGTGKTLLARALAASCSSEGQKISFFMRKGADVLSKWVGEAERQLRLLFEEAKNCQPSIIFFDEIDGLAPVRSSKQDQIHASIVSTMLALMDGMDGRGQVIVIGATNRPDAVDPALRRPGRFDREFYFPLPDFDARRKIIQINTQSWEPPLQEVFLDELADLTKGYGGADLRALCTEAALTAIQRKYPQIYKTSDRLVIKPEEIRPIARDFITSAKNLIPSTARSSSSLASPLPPHIKPLLDANLQTVITSLRRILPEVKKINVLEEAEYEPHGDGGFEQEKAMQTFENLRVFRPRLLISGTHGMGQSFIGAAVLHHLEGFHVQSLDFATLVGDPARTAEAAIVQIFTEAKRHKPSILYIPSLVGWAAAVPDSVKATMKGLLDSLDPSDPVLLLAMAEFPLSDVPADVKSWFGFLRNNRVALESPKENMREAFFAQTVDAIRRKPSEYPDAMPRKKRVLEELPIAPPVQPREPTAAELQAQEQNDQRLREYLKFRLGPIVTELKKRYKRFCKPIGDGQEIELGPPITGDAIPLADEATAAPAETNGPRAITADGDGEADADASSPAANGMDLDVTVETAAAGAGTSAQAPISIRSDAPTEVDHAGTADDAATDANGTAAPVPRTYRFQDIGLDKVQDRLYKDRYNTPEQLLGDLVRIAHNAYYDDEADSESKADQMLNHARIMIDQACDPPFRQECARMYEREKQRVKKAKDERVKKNADAAAAAVAVAEVNANDVAGDSDPFAAPKRPREDDAAMQDPSKRPRLSESSPSAAGTMPGSLIAPVSSTTTTSRDESPAPPLPDFIVPEQAIQALARYLVCHTAELTVEQMEQLRAASYDAIWCARREWDKSVLIKEIQDLAEDFISEVEAAEREGEM